ncbi:MAG: response regulator [Lachnospiraceae bacterium]|nr:response regulator [Lachnospiraceae bacterium]
MSTDSITILDGIQIAFLCISLLMVFFTVFLIKTSEAQRYLAAESIFCMIGMYGYYIDLNCHSFKQAYIACDLEYICFALGMLMLLYFVLIFEDNKVLADFLKIFFTCSSFIVLFLVGTAPVLDIFYQSLYIITYKGNTYVKTVPGPLYYIWMFNIAIVSGTLIFLTFRHYKKNRKKNRPEFLWLFIMACFLPIGWVLTNLGITKHYDLDFPSMIFATVLLTVITVRFNVLDAVEGAIDMYINDMDEGMFVTDHNGAVIFANPRIKEILGSFDWNYRGSVRHEITDFLNSNPNGFMMDDHYYSWRASDLRDAGKHLTGRVYNVYDISDTYNYTKQLITLRDQAVRANQSRNAFITNISHQIRTPINSILGMNEMIFRESDDKDVIDCSYNIREAGKSLLSLANDILDMSRMETGKLEIRNERYDVAVMINDCIQLVIGRFAEKGLEFQAEISDTIPSELVGDETRIKQCITNFLTNSIKYTDRGMVTLNVGGFKRGEDIYVLCVSVTDTGSGIREEDMPKLFGSFSRIDTGRKGKYIEGTGIGLHLTKQMVELMKGDIQVHTVYGVGSTFSVELPEKIADETPFGNINKHLAEVRKRENVEKRSFTAEGARVLVVDDNAVNLQVARGLMKPYKMRCDAATSGKQCLKMVDDMQYHIIFMDHMMPEMDGIETLKKIFELPPSMWKNTAFIALTANAGIQARASYIAEGFTDYMTKPIDLDILAEMLKKYLPEELIKYDEQER